MNANSLTAERIYEARKSNSSKKLGIDMFDIVKTAEKIPATS